MRLISNWRKAHKLSSMQLNAIALMCDGAFIGLAVWYESFPMPVLMYAGLRMGLTVAATVARLVAQESVK